MTLKRQMKKKDVLKGQEVSTTVLYSTNEGRRRGHLKQGFRKERLDKKGAKSKYSKPKKGNTFLFKEEARMLKNYREHALGYSTISHTKNRKENIAIRKTGVTT